MPSAADVLRAEERREILLELIQVRFGSVEAAVRSRVEAASMEQLVAWVRRIVVVKTIEEVFAD